MAATGKPTPIPGTYRRVTPALVVELGATLKRAPQDQEEMSRMAEMQKEA